MMRFNLFVPKAKFLVDLGNQKNIHDTFRLKLFAQNGMNKLRFES